MNEWLRPAVYVSYKASLGVDGHMIGYADLYCKYIEESVREGRRGFIVVSKSKPMEFKIPTRFATMDIVGTGIKGTWCYYVLKIVVVDSPDVRESYFSKHLALPYQFSPVKADEVDKTKTSGALVTHLQKTILGDFETDAIRAVIGEFRSANELEQKTDAISSALYEAWTKLPKPKHHITDYESDSIPVFSWDRTTIRTLSSPVVDNVLKKLFT